MKTNNSDEAQYLLRKLLLLTDPEISASHQWLSEVDRWKELVFALLTCATSLPQDTVRLLTNHLLDLDLLQIPALSGLLKGKPPALDLREVHSRRILQVLQEGGFNRDEAVTGLIVICEAAMGLDKQFGGKIQLYLRSHGEKMLAEARSKFGIKHLDDTAVRYAFTLWLQNVLNMPVPLRDETVEAFSRTNGLTSRKIFDAADEMDINVALVDDLIHDAPAVSTVTATKGISSPPVERPSRRRQRKVASRSK